MSDQIVSYLLQAYGLAGLVILALAFTVRHLYNRTVSLEEDRLQKALESQSLIKDFNATIKVVLETLRDGKIAREGKEQ